VAPDSQKRATTASDVFAFKTISFQSPRLLTTSVGYLRPMDDEKAGRPQRRRITRQQVGGLHRRTHRISNERRDQSAKSVAGICDSSETCADARESDSTSVNWKRTARTCHVVKAITLISAWGTKGIAAGVMKGLPPTKRCENATFACTDLSEQFAFLRKVV